MRIELLEKGGIRFGLKLIDGDEVDEVMSPKCLCGSCEDLSIKYSSGVVNDHYIGVEDDDWVYVLYSVVEELCRRMEEDKSL